MTASQGQGLLRCLAASGSRFTAGATGEAAVGSLDAARLLRSAACGSRFTARAAGEAAVGSFNAAGLLRSTTCGSRRAAAGIRRGLRAHPIADQSQDRSGTQRHQVSTIHDKLPNLSRNTTQSIVDTGEQFTPHGSSSDQPTPFKFGGGVLGAQVSPSRAGHSSLTRSQLSNSHRIIDSGSRQYTALFTQHPQHGRWSPPSDGVDSGGCWSGSTGWDTLVRQHDRDCSCLATRQQVD